MDGVGLLSADVEGVSLDRRTTRAALALPLVNRTLPLVFAPLGLVCLVAGANDRGPAPSGAGPRSLPVPEAKPPVRLTCRR